MKVGFPIKSDSNTLCSIHILCLLFFFLFIFFYCTLDMIIRWNNIYIQYINIWTYIKWFALLFLFYFEHLFIIIFGALCIYILSRSLAWLLFMALFDIHLLWNIYALYKINALIIKTIIDNKMFVKSVLIFLDSILFMTLAVESTSFTSTKPILGVFLWAAIAIGV